VLLGYEYVTEEAEQCQKQGPRGRGFKGESEKIAQGALTLEDHFV